MGTKAIHNEMGQSIKVHTVHTIHIMHIMHIVCITY